MPTVITIEDEGIRTTYQIDDETKAAMAKQALTIKSTDPLTGAMRQTFPSWREYMVSRTIQNAIAPAIDAFPPSDVLAALQARDDAEKNYQACRQSKLLTGVQQIGDGTPITPPPPTPDPTPTPTPTPTNGA